MVSDDRFGICGKTFDELIITCSNKPNRSIKEKYYLLLTLIKGMTLVLTRSPHFLDCYIDVIDGEPYFIIDPRHDPRANTET